MKNLFTLSNGPVCSGNNLLAKLRPAERALLDPVTWTGSLSKGYILFEPGDTVEYCFFPCHQALASYMILMDCGNAVETAMIGREGAVGGLVVSGRMPAFARAAVMHEGTFCRIALSDLDYARQQAPEIDALFNRYADCLLAQTFQSVACNAGHTIEQRASKWLCAAVERTGSSKLSITQDQIGSMMGVGRSYACRVIQRLKTLGAIRTRRNEIEILDYDALKQRSCNCNELVCAHFEKVLEGIYPRAPDGAPLCEVN